MVEERMKPGSAVARDLERNQAYGTAAYVDNPGVMVAVEPMPKRWSLLNGWAIKWTPLAYRAVEGPAPLFAEGPRPAQPGEVVEAVRTSHRTFLAQIGLE